MGTPMDVNRAGMHHSLLAADLAGGEHPFYDDVAIMVTEEPGGALHKLVNGKIQAAIVTDRRVVTLEDGTKEVREMPVIDRWGRPERVMDYEHTLDEAKAFVADGEYIIPVLNQRNANWALVHVCWTNFPKGALGWNRYPVWQMQPLELVKLGHSNSVELDDACEAAVVWARQLQDTRLLEDEDGWGRVGGWNEVALTDATLEAIDYHQRFGHRMVSASASE